MQLTRQSEYAVKTLLELAKVNEGKLVRTKAISESQNIPEVFLKKTIQLLARAGLVKTFRGSQGGVALTVSPHEISIADVIRAIEGEIAINPCLSNSFQCPGERECRVRRALNRAQEAMIKELDKESIADLLNSEC